MKKSSLNHCYKLIWNHIQRIWIVVAEHVKNKGKKSHLVNQPVQIANKTCFTLHHKAKLSLILLSALSGLGISQTVSAQWEGVVNQHGQASYQYNGNHLDVNVHSHQLIANAQSLDIASHESVNIHQLSAQDTALFRSIGPGATEIFGSLTANGHVFLINQNGVLFGQGAQVDVGSLVTSSMDMSNSDFLEGKYQFDANGGTGSVVNQGVIKVADGGYVVLLGSTVENSGSVIANQGSVVMASAEHAVLDFYGNGLVKAKLSGDALNAIVNQAGNIQADGGAVQLATNSRSSAVNMTGLVQANTLVERDGVIRLEGGDHAKVSVSGTLNATGQTVGTKGGTVEVTGEQVALFDGAAIDVSGHTGGGTALVGGDYQGANSQVYNARTTYIDQGASIKADAYQNGDGGKAVVWADQVTRYYGNISAKGGAESGNGGMVEVSGKRVLDFIGRVDVSAAQGKGGTVLLDPDNIVLENAIRTAPVNNPNGTPDLAFTDPPASGTLSIQINDVTGYSELYLQAGYNITIKDDITMATDNSIRLEANNHIRAIGKVTTSGTGNIALIADADKNNSGDLYIYRGVSARQGDITLSGANIIGTANGHIVTLGGIGQDSGNVSIHASNDVSLQGNIAANGRNGTAGVDGSNAGTVNITAGGKITTGNISAHGGHGGTGDTAGGDASTINVNSTGAGDISIGTLNASAGAARGSGAGGLQGAINVANASGNITTNNIYVQGNTSGNAGNISLTAVSGNIAMNGNVYAYGGTTGSGSLADGTSGGDITIKASGDVSVTGRVYTRGGAVGSGNTANGGHGGDVNITAANVTVTDTINTNGGRALGVNQIGGNAGNVTVKATGAISTQDISANGGNAGSGTGSNAAGGDAGDISLSSTGAGDITTSNITARTGYSQGNAIATGISSVKIDNDNGAITTGNLTTRGQRNGYGGDITAVTTGGDITVGIVDARASNVAASNGGDVILATTTGDATVTDIRTGGRWLVYSGDPRNDSIGAFKSTADFKQYNTNYGETLLDTGNGFVYRYAPIITATLTGSTSKVYDGNTAVTSLGGLGISQSGAIDGDTVNLSALTSATYDNKNAGTSKTVTSNVLSITSASNGTTKVYGYQTAAAKGDVGEITPRAITVTAATDTKTYDGNTSSVGLPTVTSGSLVAGDTASFTQTFDNKNAGTGKTLSASGSIADGNSGNNYAVTYIDDNTGVINPKAITVTANAGQSKNVFAADPATLTYSVNGLVSGDRLTGSLVRNPGEAIGSYAIKQGTLNGDGNYTINYIGDTFSILANTTSENTNSLNPRNSAGLGQLLTVDANPQQFVAVFNVGATAAGGDLDTQNTCQSDEDKSLMNPNTSLMLNFGITLPEGVEEYCI